MGDRGAERRLRRPLWIDVNILVVASRFSELIDAFLVDQHPFGNANFFTNVAIELIYTQSKCHENSPGARVLIRAAVYQQSRPNPMLHGVVTDGPKSVGQGCGQKVVKHESTLLQPLTRNP